MKPMVKMYQLRRFSLGNATSLAPIISGMTKLPSTAGTAGIEHEEDHRDAVHREHPVVDVGRQQVACRRGQLHAGSAPRRCRRALNAVETTIRYRIADPLVVLRQQPRRHGVPVVDVVDGVIPCTVRLHKVLLFAVPARRRLRRGLRRPRAPRPAAST